MRNNVKVYDPRDGSYVKRGSPANLKRRELAASRAGEDRARACSTATRRVVHDNPA